ncbi:TetR/AcrR family transcriptional regulator [Amycolatopsis samaneae]|uniref:TetR/AcrR family transcriptional regulator n=1 Tax=Amycolatopsis samaneae TaxID=664691 RepID=A0ABW5GXK8_9PSEU
MVRGKLREDAILGATLELLAESGYRALTMDAVAARAHASKTTIYRRWRNKAELVRATLDAYDSQSNDDVEDTGTLRGDLLAVVGMLRVKSTQLPVTLYHEMLEISRHDKELDAALRAHLANEEVSPVLAPIRRAVERGELPEDVDTDLIHDVAEAMILHRVQYGEFDDAFTVRLVDDVLLVLLTRGEK